MIPIRLWSSVVSHESQPFGGSLSWRTVISGLPPEAVAGVVFAGAAAVVI
jgi:hypothetical protein